MHLKAIYDKNGFSQACSISFCYVITLNLYPPTGSKEKLFQHKIEIFFI